MNDDAMTTIKCENCNQVFMYADHLVGKSVACPKCSTMLHIPADASMLAINTQGNFKLNPLTLGSKKKIAVAFLVWLGGMIACVPLAFISVAYGLSKLQRFGDGYVLRDGTVMSSGMVSLSIFSEIISFTMTWTVLCVLFVIVRWCIQVLRAKSQ